MPVGLNRLCLLGLWEALHPPMKKKQSAMNTFFEQNYPARYVPYCDIHSESYAVPLPLFSAHFRAPESPYSELLVQPFTLARCRFVQHCAEHWDPMKYAVARRDHFSEIVDRRSRGDRTQSRPTQSGLSKLLHGWRSVILLLFQVNLALGNGCLLEYLWMLYTAAGRRVARVPEHNGYD